ncbi:hypothetical protein BDQ17DRAFT_1362733 [Cyathus striatus]|nr:hypothetical protein BDQ17DRAFT_1362733 [Cyathus striatus]
MYAFRCGMFMDFFAMGSDLYKGPIPGSGDYKMTFTALADIGNSLHWPEELSMAGETLTYNEVVRMAEEAIGEKFSTDESVEKKDEVTQRLMDSYTAFAKGMGESRIPI